MIKLENPYREDGHWFASTAKDNIATIMDNVSFRKFGNAFRKHIDKDFTQEMNEPLPSGMAWSELAGYLIGDGDYTLTQEQYEAFVNVFPHEYSDSYSSGGGVGEVNYFKGELSFLNW